MREGFQLFREQVAGEYNRLFRQLSTNRNHVIARARLIVSQVEAFSALPDLTEAEAFWIEVIRESFEELIVQAGGAP